MNQKELSIVLRELACNQPTPLCKEWTNEWADDTDIDTLLEKFVRGQDFCITNNYPPLDFIRKNFNKDELHRHLIFLDDDIDIKEAPSGVYIFLGKCEGSICFEGFSVGTLYVRHDSNIKVYAKDMAKAFVSVYDEAVSDCFESGGAVTKWYDRRK